MFDRTVPFRPIVFAGGCLFLQALACSEISSPSDGGGAGGSGENGGGAGVAGNQAGTGGGGAEGGSAGAPLDAGSDASSGASGSGGSAVTPPGCPEPTPTAGNDEQTVVIQSVHFGRSEVVLKNISAEDQTIIGGRQGWQWCNAPDYWNIILTENDVVLGPGETYKFTLIRETGQFRQLYPGEDSADANELGIYTTTGSFMTAGLMVAFVSWGEGSSGNSRENVAGMASLWVFGERVEITPGHAGFIATGPANRGSGYTSVPARCLPASP